MFGKQEVDFVVYLHFYYLVYQLRQNCIFREASCMYSMHDVKVPKYVCGIGATSFSSLREYCSINSACCCCHSAALLIHVSY